MWHFNDIYNHIIRLSLKNPIIPRLYGCGEWQEGELRGREERKPLAEHGLEGLWVLTEPPASLYQVRPAQICTQPPPAPTRRVRGRDAGSRAHTQDAWSGFQSPTPVPPQQLTGGSGAVLVKGEDSTVFLIREEKTLAIPCLSPAMK